MRRKRLLYRNHAKRLERPTGTRPVCSDELLCNLSGIIRAWHRHNRGQVDYFTVLRGTLKICAYDEDMEELDEIVSTGQDLQVLRMPGHYWHGFKAAGDETALLVYFTTNLYDYQNPDEERRPWNDPKIVPKLINGKKDDPRTGKPWDWNYPPYK